MAINIPLKRVLFILIGFPIVSYLISLMLLKREWLTEYGLDFFTIFWSLITLWYVLQIIITIKVLKKSNLSLSDIGYKLDRRKSIWFISSYLVFSGILVIIVELALASAEVTSEDIKSLSDLANLTPITTTSRIIFVFMGLFAGLAEEFVYRGFAINALNGFGINKWIAIVIASIPFVFQHGLKSIDQFWWFFIWGIALGLLFILAKRRLYINIVIHWLIILSAILAILQLAE